MPTVYVQPRAEHEVERRESKANHSWSVSKKKNNSTEKKELTRHLQSVQGAASTLKLLN